MSKARQKSIPRYNFWHRPGTIYNVTIFVFLLNWIGALKYPNTICEVPTAVFTADDILVQCTPNLSNQSIDPLPKQLTLAPLSSSPSTTSPAISTFANGRESSIFFSTRTVAAISPRDFFIRDQNRRPIRNRLPLLNILLYTPPPLELNETKSTDIVAGLTAQFRGLQGSVLRPELVCPDSPSSACDLGRFYSGHNLALERPVHHNRNRKFAYMGPVWCNF